jgi:tetratricopeptide (TPR) repeat protein
MNSRTLFCCLSLLLLLSVPAVYSNSISNGFVWDDEVQILNNPWIKDVKHLGKMFSSDVFGYYQSVAVSNYYRPVAHVFYTATWLNFGSSARAFHLVNLILHAIVTFLVFVVSSRLLTRSSVVVRESNRKGRRPAGSETATAIAAFAAALLFSVHPVHAEAVNWISGIMELAFTLFGLLSFLFFMDLERKGRTLSLYVSAFFFLLALFSKETAVVFLPLFLVYDLSRADGDSVARSSFGKYVPYLGALAVYFSLRTHALGSFVPADMHPELSTYECVINVFPLFVQHLSKLVWPIDLNVFHVFHPVRSILEPRTLLGLGVAAGYLAGLPWFWKRDRLVFFALVLIVVPLLPLFYIRAIAPLLFAEQHLYLPSLGLSLLIARIVLWAASRDTKIRCGVGLVFCLATFFFSAVTVQRNPVWKDNLSLWSDAVEKSPESAFVHESLAGALLSGGRLDEAIEHYRLTLESDPKPPARTFNNIGIAYSRKGWTDKAIESFSRALSIRPDYARAHIGLGIAYFEKGSTDRSIAEFRRAIEIDPYLIDAYHNLSVAYRSQGRHREADEAMRAASRLNPAYHEKGR